MNEEAFVELRERVALCNGFTPEEREMIRAGLTLVERWQHRHDKPAAAVLETPPNYLGRIDHLWAALSVDDGGEGLCAAPMASGIGTMPLIAADKRRLDVIRPWAERLAGLTSRPVRIVKFSQREDIEIFQP